MKNSKKHFLSLKTIFYFNFYDRSPTDFPYQPKNTSQSTKKQKKLSKSTKKTAKSPKKLKNPLKSTNKTLKVPRNGEIRLKIYRMTLRTFNLS